MADADDVALASVTHPELTHPELTRFTHKRMAEHYLGEIEASMRERAAKASRTLLQGPQMLSDADFREITVTLKVAELHALLASRP